MLIQCLRKEKIHIRHTYMLWFQGEADANLKTTGEEYKGMLKQLVSYMEEQGVEACFLIQLGPDLTDPAKHQEIMQAQLAQVGVTMNIERMESNAWSNDVLRRSDFEFNLIATTLGFPDFDERYALVVSGQPQNFYHIADPELDAAF